MSKQKCYESSKDKKRLIVRGPDAIAAALGLRLSRSAEFEAWQADVWRFERAIDYFNLHVFKSGNDPWCVYQEDLDKVSVESSRYVIRGIKAIAEALGFTADETCVKRVRRAIKAYDLPVFKDKNQMCICRADIENLLINRTSISGFLDISEKTLSRWIKKYPEIPIKNKHGIPCADKLQLFWWYEVRIRSIKISNLKNCNCSLSPDTPPLTSHLF